MTILSLTPEYIFHTKIPNHQEIKDKYLPLLEKDHTLRARQGYTASGTTVFGQNNFHLFDESFVQDVVWKPFHKMLDELPPIHHHSIIKTIKISDIWYNRYLKDHICKPHIHTGCSFSAIYLLHLQEPNPTVFIPNLQNYSYMMYENNIETKHITEGEVMIFPSNMLHYCLPIVKERWVVVWNYSRPNVVVNRAYKNADKYKVTE